MSPYQITGEEDGYQAEQRRQDQTEVVEFHVPPYVILRD